MRLGAPVVQPVLERDVYRNATFGKERLAGLNVEVVLVAGRALLEAFERLRPRLAVFRDERGQALIDVPVAPLPGLKTPAPPRFLPAFDNALLSHADRTRVVSDGHRKALSKDPFMRGVLLDGFGCGTWKMERTDKSTDLVIEPFGPLA